MSTRVMSTNVSKETTVLRTTSESFFITKYYLSVTVYFKYSILMVGSNKNMHKRKLKLNDPSFPHRAIFLVVD